MEKVFRAGLLVGCVSFLLPLVAAAQQPVTPQLQPVEPVQPAASAAPDRAIRLDVVVTDHGGKPVANLQRESFSVTDNKQPAKLLSFEPETGASLTPDSAVQILLVIDEVNTTFSRVAYEREEIKKFLTANGGRLAHPVSLVFFSDEGAQIQTVPSGDGNGLSAAIDKHETALRSIRRSTGVYGAEDRVQLSLDTLESLAAKEATIPGRKLLLWVSPGWPLLSGPRIDLTSKQEQGVFNSVVKITTALRRANITLYSIDPLGTEDAGGLRTIYYQEFLKGMTSPKNAQLGNLALQVFATQTGGQVLFGSNSIRDLLNRCVRDADAFYVLTIPAAPSDRGDDYHEVQVNVGTPGLTARTRTGYYAQP